MTEEDGVLIRFAPVFDNFEFAARLVGQIKMPSIEKSDFLPIRNLINKFLKI